MISPRNQLERAILWDLDGTLIDSAGDLAFALNRLLAEHGLASLAEESVRGMVGDGAARLVERGFAAAGKPIDNDSRDDALRQFLHLYGENPVRSTRTFDGALEVMKALSRAGCVHGVCTNKPAAITATILDRLGLARWIRAVVGGDSTPYKKPHPAPLLYCLDELGAGGLPALVVGDSENDLLAARAARLPVIVVTFGYSRKPVQDLGADALVERLEQIPQVLSELPSFALTRN